MLSNKKSPPWNIDKQACPSALAANPTEFLLGSLRLLAAHDNTTVQGLFYPRPAPLLHAESVAPTPTPGP